MTINTQIEDFTEFISSPTNWSKFLSIYYSKADLLEIRTLNGSAPVDFEVIQVNSNNIVIKISNPKLTFMYNFTLTNNDDKTKVELLTNYKISYLESRALRLLGINITPSGQDILTNIDHFLTHGHIH